MLIVHFNHVVQVAADMPRRDIAPGKAVAFELREVIREQAALNLARNFQLALQPLFGDQFLLRRF